MEMNDMIVNFRIRFILRTDTRKTILNIKVPYIFQNNKHTSICEQVSNKQYYLYKSMVLIKQIFNK